MRLILGHIALFYLLFGILARPAVAHTDPTYMIPPYGEGICKDTSVWECATKVDRVMVARLPRFAQRTGPTLTLTLTTNRKLVYRDLRDRTPNAHTYSFLGIMAQRYLIVILYGYESMQVLAIDSRSGTVVNLPPGFPDLSPDARYMLVQWNDPYNIVSGLQVFELTPQGLRQIWQHQWERRRISKTKWHSATAASFLCDDSPGTLAIKDATVVMNVEEH